MAKKKKREQPEEAPENAERWLLTYADMMTLLVAFFILMYSMSVANIKKFNQVAIAIRSGFGGDFGQKGISIAERGWPSTFKESTIGGSASDKMKKIVQGRDKSTDSPETQELMKLFEYVNTQLATLKLDHSFVPLLDIDAQEGNRVRVIMSDRLRFVAGSSDLTEEDREEVLRVGKMIKDSTFKIAIDGYTASSGENVGDGWALSFERARQVAILLANEAKINPRRLMISGYGEWKDPGKSRRLKMTEQGAWEKVDEVESDAKHRDVVLLSLIIK
jgi:chemotaxis protein MotB